MTGRGEDTGRETDMKKSIPDFKSLEEEAKFWEEHSILEFVCEEDVSDFLRFGGNKSAVVTIRIEPLVREQTKSCLLYTSDAADDLLCVDLGGRRIIKKKKKKKKNKKQKKT